jgi:hypothetical protein
MPQAKNMSVAEAKVAVKQAIKKYCWEETSPWYKSARVWANNVNVYGYTANADDWAKRFITTQAKQGTGVIDASAATGKVLIVADNTVNTVKLGPGSTTVLVSQSITGRETYVLNSGANSKPTIALKANDVIKWDTLPQVDWTAGSATTFDDQIAVNRTSPPYLRYSYFDRWSQGSETDPTFQAIVRANTKTDTNDPAEIIINALTPPTVTINLSSGQAEQTSASSINFTVVFNEAMSDFDANDITLSGPAATVDGAGIVVANSGGDKIHFSVTVTLADTASEGAVSATIADGMVRDEEGFTNLASTSTHNRVTYKPNTIAGREISNCGPALAAVGSSGQPLPGVHVSLGRSTPGFTERTTTTDSNGYYRFENVPDGTYQVTVTPPNACIDLGSNTTAVTAEGSQTYEADFSVGALKPGYIPNRMMVTSSLPVGSAQWERVVREALDLGEQTASGRGAQLNVAATVQTAASQYLTLAPRNANLVSHAPIAKVINAALVKAAYTKAGDVPWQIAQAELAPIVQEAVGRWEKAGLEQTALNEMQNTTIDGQLPAVNPQALDRIDLLTVVEHELGHVAGLKDSDIRNLMGPSLEAGLRLVPSAHDAALASL